MGKCRRKRRPSRKERQAVVGGLRSTCGHGGVALKAFGPPNTSKVWISKSQWDQGSRQRGAIHLEADRMLKESMQEASEEGKLDA